MEFFLSQITYWANTFAPRSWMFCSGQIIAISDNSALYALLGPRFGGDGRVTFGLPDLRGRVPVGSSEMGVGPGLSVYPVGVRYGFETITLSNSQMPAHTHAIDISQAEVRVRFGASSERADVHIPDNGSSLAAPYITSSSTAVAGYNSSAPDVALEGTTAQLGGTISAGTTGGGLHHENRQPFEAINACICIEGIFPSRN